MYHSLVDYTARLALTLSEEPFTAYPRNGDVLLTTPEGIALTVDAYPLSRERVAIVSPCCRAELSGDGLVQWELNLLSEDGYKVKEWRCTECQELSPYGGVELSAMGEFTLMEDYELAEKLTALLTAMGEPLDAILDAQELSTWLQEFVRRVQSTASAYASCSTERPVGLYHEVLVNELHDLHAEEQVSINFC